MNDINQKMPPKPNKKSRSSTRNINKTPCNDNRFLAIIDQKKLLFKHIEDFSDAMSSKSINVKNHKIINEKELENAIKDFKGFFEAYFDYFQYGDKEEYQKRMSCECVLSTALAQIRSIWVCLSWAVNQRFIAIYEQRLKELNKETDKLMALSSYFFKQHHHPIIYLDKFVHITRYTYPTSPLLGIAIDRTLEESRLSLAHELGHYAFWDSGNLKEYTRQIKAVHNIIFIEFSFDKINYGDYESAVHATKTKMEMFTILKSWAEEILADIFATLLVGAEYAKSCQDILVRDVISNTDDHIKNDGEHPIPRLRPLIPLIVLKEIEKKERNNIPFVFDLNLIIEKLEIRWEEFTISNTDQYLKNISDWKIKDLENHLVKVVINIVNNPIYPKNKSLIDLVSYWGSIDNPVNNQMLNQFFDQLDNDFLSTTPPPPKDHVGINKSNATTQTNNHNFKAFLDYMEVQNKMYENNSPVWEDVLLLNLIQTEHYTCEAVDSNGRLMGLPCS